ncbi:hypothetical protein MMC06_005283 [Schaereria dolodes]|nr:hypothetical protein [Schaereria dolodes]
MSYASYDQEVPRRHRSHRERRSRPVYEEEEIIESRHGPPRGAPRQMSLIRREDSDESVEEVRRDFPPPNDGTYVKRRTTVRDKYVAPRTRSVDHSYREDYHDDRKRGGRREERKSSRRRRYSSESSSESPSPPRNRRRKSMGEQALAALGIGGGLGGLAATLTGKKEESRSRSRDRNRDRRGGRDRGSSRRRARSYSRGSSSSRSRSRSVDQAKKIQQAVKAGLMAGAVEAFRSRKEPGPWTGDKGKRILTAAIGAGGVNGLVDKDPDKHSKRHVAEAVLGGLATNRLVNGSRARSASRGRDSKGGGGGGGGLGGLGGLAAGGLAAAAGKAFMDHRERSKSRGRRYSSSSDDSRSPPRRRSRSKSVGAYVSRGLNKGMAAIGLGGDKNEKEDKQVSRRDDRGYDQYQPRPRGGGGEEEHKEHDSSTDYSSGEEQKKIKKMRGKEVLTAGLATVATIHAAHSVYQSMEGRKKRHKEVLEGKMSPEEAKKKKNKARLQDAASIGIAALGIKGAVSEWKETREQREEFHKMNEEFSTKRQRRQEKLRSRSHGPGEYGENNGGYRNSEPSLAYQNGYAAAPRYQDGNPYSSSALPPPPIGAPPARY